MDSLWPVVADFLTVDKLLVLVRALVLVFVGLLAAKFSSRAAVRALQATAEAQRAELARRVVYYGVLTLFSVAAVHQLGFNLGVLLGAAGIFTVALGFASQTSASNLVSGLFLIAESPFQPGDVIVVGGTTGEVLSIDLLAITLRTYDNQFVRVPNETMIKTEVRTLTKFPIRRADLLIGVAYKEDLDRVRKVLLDVADRNPLCLEEPKPLFIFKGFGDSSMDIQFSVWATRENYLEVKNSIQLEIKRAFDDAGIEIPFPHRSVYAGSVTEPLPIRLVSEAQTAGTATI